MAHISDLNNYWSLLVLGTGEWYHPWNLEAIWFALAHGTIQKYLKKSPSCCAYGSCNGQKVFVDYLTKSEKWTILTLKLMTSTLWLGCFGLIFSSLEIFLCRFWIVPALLVKDQAVLDTGVSWSRTCLLFHTRRHQYFASIDGIGFRSTANEVE